MITVDQIKPQSSVQVGIAWTSSPSSSITGINVFSSSGPTGLTTLKCLHEEGFNAIDLERRDKAGGLWAYSDNTSFTSALESTINNLSKFIVSNRPSPSGRLLTSSNIPTCVTHTAQQFPDARRLPCLSQQTSDSRVLLGLCAAVQPGGAHPLQHTSV